LYRSRTQGIARLSGIATLKPTMTLLALADVDVELPANGAARNRDLKLLGDVGLVHAPTGA
jgi:hypothetical protein